MPSPITAIDHLHLRVPNLDTAISDYRLLMGCHEHWRGDLSGTPAAAFEVGNLGLCLTQDDVSSGLSGICFRVDDIQRLRRRAKNLGMGLASQRSKDPLSDVFRSSASSSLERLEPDAARGLDVSFVERPGARAYETSPTVLGLDHVVIATGDGDATALFLGARLGLDLRMDLSRPDWNARLLFFRCGDLIVEVFQKLDDAGPRSEDAFYGLSWRVGDAVAARERLAAEGFDVSDVRPGRKPGTQVFTARNRTGGVATLFLQPPS